MRDDVGRHHHSKRNLKLRLKLRVLSADKEWHGFRVAEVPVGMDPRVSGTHTRGYLWQCYPFGSGFTF